jgi:AcrR family transcriptional regulator
MGMVQHYFTTKDQMLRFAVEMMAEDTRERIRRRIAGLPQPPEPRLLVRTVLAEMIPDVRRRQVEAEAAGVWVRRFLLQPDTESPLVRSYDDVRDFLVGQILLGRDGSPADADRDANALIALIDGLNYNIVTGHQTARTALVILDAQLDHVFGTA